MEALRLWLPVILSAASLLWAITLYRLSARKGEIESVKGELKSEIATLKASLTEHNNRLERQIDANDAELKLKAGRPWVEGLQNAIQDLAPRVQKIEVECMHMPTGNQFHLLALKVETMSGDIKVMAEAVKTSTEMTRTMQDYLLTDSGRGGQ